ncbi:MAG: DUF3644 domain-containing protein [Myxococcales bacterium]|nr:DUF3644 domain-containing protein [Myxococcales bacterium]
MRVKPAGGKVDKVRRSYQFLADKENAGTAFTIEDIVQATGWKPGTIETYLRKKWGQIVHQGTSGLRCKGVCGFTETEYVRLMSQKDEVSADPRRPDLAPEVEALVRKSRESALLALHVYNSPATVFRTEGFAVLMVIAWTSLFHAIFEERSVSYFYTEPDGVTPKVVDGDKKAWELDTCMKKFWAAADHATRRNLEFFIRLRNRVEHRYVPSIDPHVAGECQALLLNFDEMLVEHFGTYYAIRESLAVPLQTTALRAAGQTEALRKLQAKHFDDVKEFIDAYRTGLPGTLYEDPKFAFRVFLVPKTGNHANTSDLAFEFIKYDPSRPEEMAQIQKQIALVKERQVPVANANLLSPKLVAKDVAAKIGRPFNLHHHKLAWVRYKVRRSGFDPGGCNPKYCVADPRHGDYGYTQDWVTFLVAKLSDQAEYDALVKSKG